MCKAHPRKVEEGLLVLAEVVDVEHRRRVGQVGVARVQRRVDAVLAAEVRYAARHAHLQRSTDYQ